MATPVSVPKHWLGFSYISLKDYELDQNFDKYNGSKPDHTSNDKVK